MRPLDVHHAMNQEEKLFTEALTAAKTAESLKPDSEADMLVRELVAQIESTKP